ncbi:MAG: SbcC/MukB-like Walker B domain-containing protein [Lachnospiraceae bacterium]|nr:AAA family ATPase [Robinsoniella sp.]MDY3767566.1 SbcC/MukB-like Walker B domain-containing protein [Lachnospiraceae bacterium]
MDSKKKILTRIQLVNWHYFENERIAIQGSALISGENTAGKSTILDAIQLVLTTNTRRFNVAANEKGNRNLKGYVRCKVGNVGETYLRKNVVPANVALEFYEEKENRYFVIGVHMTSQDEESPVITKWYVEECRLENLSFIVDRHPALADEFKVNNRRVRYIEQKNAARDRFKRRLGNLDDKFFDIIPKSLAFKPMDNVKDFINKFVLSENKIDVVSLRENIETLSELEFLLERSQKQYNALEAILETYQKVENKDHDIVVNEILLAIANKDALDQELEELEKQIRTRQQSVEENREQLEAVAKKIQTLDEQMIGINVTIQSNSSNKMLEDAKRRIRQTESEITLQGQQERKLNEQVKALKFYTQQLQKIQQSFLTASELSSLLSEESTAQKNPIVEKIEQFQSQELEKIRKRYAEYSLDMDRLNREITGLQERLRELEKRNLTYPENTVLLKNAIEKEFEKRSIRSKVYILAELLEITDEVWINAVEGYLNQQKFYLIVEPQYYDVALEVYERRRKQIHTAGIINTKKIPTGGEVNNQSLAYVVKSENRYAKAYANYVLGRVIRCESAKELENHDIAITAQCMLYQGFVVRHMNPKSYQDPYIGQNAYRVQIVNVRKALEEKSSERSSLREEIKQYSSVLESEKKFDFTILKLYLNSPAKKAELKRQLVEEKMELEKASKDPTLIQLQIELNEKRKEKSESVNVQRKLTEQNASLRNQIESLRVDVKGKQRRLSECTQDLEQKMDADSASYQQAEEKYRFNRKTKTAKKIAENFAPKRTQFENEKNELLGNLKDLQYRYNTDFTQDFVVGLSGMPEYQEAAQKLKTVEMIRYEEKLHQAKEDCEQIFRSDFLSKMKELIENAKMEFRNLNKALDSIYYGDDSYRFKLSFDKKKEGLYRMITSENNQEGINLWTAAFEEQYHEEMAELFDKLMTKDDKGQKILDEYTDYRSYLDYDIEIHKRDGSVQRFSDIYGEKSGSETQVPYYVAIAASFYQIYRYGNSVRVMLLDEAFDKMDDERIASMMDFFNGLDLQVIMATPPAKIEIIGEKVDTVLAAIRVGQSSIVEEYDF